MTLDQTTALRLLREAVAQSGLCAAQYARNVLIRNDRTLRRWLAGESPIPQAVSDYLLSRSQDDLLRRGKELLEPTG